ncbi:ParA family protein, partial [Vibrio parahaemolyticus]
KPLNWVMPMLEDFSEQRDTARTRNEISAFLHEVIL